MSKKPYRIPEQKKANDIEHIEELEQKIRKHRWKVLKIILLAAVLFLGGATGLYYAYQAKSYSQYQVTESIKREDSAGTNFAEFNGNILKYSNDGVFYIDAQNNLIWNQTYEMQSPMLDICEGYLTIAEQGGKQIFIMDAQGPCGEIKTNLPIQQVHVANQGTIAVLMEEDGTGYLQLYDRKGTFLAEGELHTKNSGYPLDIALSNDGKKMAVSMLDVNEGTVKTTIAFYNFGSVGQNEIDNIVSTYSYSNLIIPKVEFLTNDTAVGIGDSALILYEGSQKPVEKKTIEITREIRSTFYNENYVGLVFENENKDKPYEIQVYDLKGSLITSMDFSIEYETIEFLKNSEICILNNLECGIYTLRGKERFHYNFKQDIYKILSAGPGRRYLFLVSGETQKVRLK